MTDRGLPIVDGAPACPFVAFEDDRDARGTAPDHRHRCYAEPRPAPRAAAHQEAYCLSSAFPVCPTFQDWARREAAIARAKEADDEADLPPLEEPESQPLPPLERPAQRAPGTDTPPPLAPRRNPPRDWAAPPPWTGDDGQGDAAEPPPFLAPAAPAQPASQPASVDRAADDAAYGAAAYGAASRGLAGSAADRLAGSYGSGQDFDDDDPSYAPSSSGYAPSPGLGPPDAGPADVPRARAGLVRRPAGPRPGGAARSLGLVFLVRAAAVRPGQAAAPGPGGAVRARVGASPPVRGLPVAAHARRASRARQPAADRRRGHRHRAGRGGPVLHRPDAARRGQQRPGGRRAAATVAPADATATPIPTVPPEPTPKIYVVAKGDTMSKIARKNHVTVEQLLAANPKIKNPNLIKVGDKVTIPVPEADGGASAAP